MTAITETQIEAINAMPPEERYDYFISKVSELEQVWGLAGEDGWFILPDEDDELLPVWPHIELAAQWAVGELSDCSPQAIPLDEWLNKWLPGMEDDGLLAAICPAPDGNGIVVSAGTLGEETREHIKQ